MSSWDDDTTVILSAGPVRVDTSEPDPEFVPRPVGFVYVEPEPTAEDLQRAEYWARMQQAERLTMVQTGSREWTIVAQERVAIADQDPWGGWGDQA